MQSLRLTLRSLARRPTFTLTAIITLALGIGATTAVFSVVSALLLRPLPYADPGQLVAVWPGQSFANREVDALRSRSRTLAPVATFSPGWLMALTGTEEPRQLSAARVSGNLFDLLGVPAELGRTFGMEAEAPGRDLVAVLSWDLWRSTFAGATDIVGRSIQLDGTAYTVVAVMPRGFRTFETRADLWTPLTMDRSAMTWAGATSMMFGRLRPGRTPDEASSELRTLAADIRDEFQLAPTWSVGASVAPLQAQLVGGTRAILLVLLTAVGALLLIASANVANLLLVRTAERRQELTVRAALGATPSHLARYLLVECALLGAFGGIAGVALAWGGVRALPLVLPASLPRVGEIAVDGRVLVAAAAITVLTVLLFGLAPSLGGMAAGRFANLRAGPGVSTGGARARGALVALEVGLAVVLTVGAALMLRTLASLTAVDPGFRADHLLTMRLQPTGFESQDALRAYWRDILDRVEEVPGVTRAATILHLPTSGRSWHAAIEIEGRPLAAGESPPRAAWQSISRGWFATTGVPIIRGRDFEDADVSSAPRVIAVNAAFAARLFPGEDPVGRRIKAGNATQGEFATILAVVGGIRHDSLNTPPVPEVYVPFSQRIVWANSLVLRTIADPAGLAPLVRERIWSVNRNVPISEVRTMDDLFSASLGRARMVLILLAVFAILGLVLGAVGIYGVVAYGVRQRTRELGIRAALGADGTTIARLVVGSGLRYAVIGVALGIPAALAASRLMRGLIFGIAPTDPVSFAAVPLLMLAVAAAASWVPARRAAKADPAAVLRES